MFEVYYDEQDEGLSIPMEEDDGNVIYMYIGRRKVVTKNIIFSGSLDHGFMFDKPTTDVEYFKDVIKFLFTRKLVDYR